MAPILWLLQIWDLYAFKWIYDTGVRKYGTRTSTVDKKQHIIYTSSSPTRGVAPAMPFAARPPVSLVGGLLLNQWSATAISNDKLNEPKTISFDTICGKSMETYLKKIHLRISCINSIDANPIRHRETFSPPRVWPQHLTMTWKVVEESRPAMNCFSRFPNKGVLLKGK